MEKIKYPQTQELISAHLDDELTGSQKSQLENELLANEQLVNEMTQMSKIREFYKTAVEETCAPPPPPQLFEKLEKQLADKPNNNFRHNSYAIAASFLLVCTLSFLLIGPMINSDYSNEFIITESSYNTHHLSFVSQDCSPTGNCSSSIHPYGIDKELGELPLHSEAITNGDLSDCGILFRCVTPES